MKINFLLPGISDPRALDTVGLLSSKTRGSLGKQTCPHCLSPSPASGECQLKVAPEFPLEIFIFFHIEAKFTERVKQPGCRWPLGACRGDGRWQRGVPAVPALLAGAAVGM